MHQPAIQAALDNLVEVIRTALSAEFLEFIRGEAQPAGGRRRGASAKAKKRAKAPRAKATSKTTAKKAAKRARK